MPSLANRILRSDAILPAGLLIAGSLTFLGGGRMHPVVSPGRLGGPYGSEQFYRGFAHEMLHTHGWEEMHMLILVGPILWALGAGAVTRLFPARVAALGEIARSALLIAAGAWALAFILDGYVGPAYARAIEASPPGSVTPVMSAFGLSQFTMARLGMVSVALMGAAILAWSGALLGISRFRSWAGAVGLAGMPAGLWLLYASGTGEFDPGPFTSPHWRLTAVAMAAWMVLFATVMPSIDRRHEETATGLQPLAAPTPAGQ